MTRTYARLDVSEAAYNEIAGILTRAGYHHAFHQHGYGMVIDMHGLALSRAAVRMEPESGAMRTQVSLTRWQSRTVIYAEQIKAAIVISPPSERIPPTDHDVTLVLSTGAEIGVPKTFIVHGIPSPGDYFVHDADGVQYWLPCHEFEATYVHAEDIP